MVRKPCKNKSEKMKRLIHSVVQHAFDPDAAGIALPEIEKVPLAPCLAQAGRDEVERAAAKAADRQLGGCTIDRPQIEVGLFDAPLASGVKPDFAEIGFGSIGVGYAAGDSNCSLARAMISSIV